MMTQSDRLDKILESLDRIIVTNDREFQTILLMVEEMRQEL